MPRPLYPQKVPPVLLEVLIQERYIWLQTAPVDSDGPGLMKPTEHHHQHRGIPEVTELVIEPVISAWVQHPPGTGLTFCPLAVSRYTRKFTSLFCVGFSSSTSMLFWFFLTGLCVLHPGWLLVSSVNFYQVSCWGLRVQHARLAKIFPAIISSWFYFVILNKFFYNGLRV